MADERRAQVRTADRSERVRTYNFHENRVTDHRIGYTVHRLAEVLEGDLDDLIDALTSNLSGPAEGVA
jgi:peptide chain release factor 1